MDESEALKDKTIEWAGTVANTTTGDAEFVIRCTDGSVCVVGAWQRVGYPTEMSVDMGAMPSLERPPSAVVSSPTKGEVPKMTVGELIQKLQTLPSGATVKTWSAYDDRETDEVHVSISEDGVVFVLETAIGREV